MTHDSYRGTAASETGQHFFICSGRCRGRLHKGERIGCVSGIVLPARLDNAVENLFEEIGGTARAGASSGRPSPSPGRRARSGRCAVRAGSNMAFRRGGARRHRRIRRGARRRDPDRGRRGHARDNARHALRVEVAYEPSPSCGITTARTWPASTSTARVQRRTDRLLRAC